MGSVMKGLGVQSDFQASNPYDQSYLQTQVQNQSKVMQQQQDLATMLQAMAAGNGPNPAQTQYNQNVSQNIQGAQGLIASQRGLNPALATRMGANVAANANQQAAGQSELLGQQQQIAALGGLGDVYGQMQQGNLQGQQLYGQQNLGMQQLNQQTKSGNASQIGQLYGSIIGAGGKAATQGAAHGGMVPSQGGAQSKIGMMMQGQPAMPMNSGGMIPGQAPVSGDSVKNDKVPIMASPKEIIIPRSISTGKDAPEKAKQFVAAILARQGMKERRK